MKGRKKRGPIISEGCNLLYTFHTAGSCLVPIYAEKAFVYSYFPLRVIWAL